MTQKDGMPAVEHPQADERSKEGERYRTLLEINNAIITKLTQGELLHAICEALKRAVPFDSVGLLLHEPEGDVLRSVALEGPLQTTHFRVGVEVNKGTLGWWVFEHQRAILRRDLETERQTPLEHLAFSEGVRSLCALPLIAQEESIGVLFVARLTRNQYSEEDISFLQRIVNQFALAIRNMKSYEKIASLNTQVARSEKRWRAVFENSAIGVALEDMNGCFLAANPAYQKMLGYTEEELQKLTFVDVTHEDCRRRNLELAAELREGKREQFQIEKQYRRKDGSMIWVNLNVSLVPETGSMPRFFMVLAEDIAERKRAQEALQESEKRARTLLEINNAIITSHTQEALLSAVSGALQRVVPFDVAALTLYIPESDQFSFLGVEGIIPYFHVGRKIDHQKSSVGWVFDHRQPMVRRDLEKEQQYSNEERLAAAGIHSHCVVPLIIRGSCIGTLNVGSKAKNQYSQQHAALLQEVANQVVLAVENMKAYEEIRALKERAEAENVYLREEILKEHNFDEIVGNSPALLELLQKIEAAAPTDATVLLYGETGTGKELLARAIHSRSTRYQRAMVTVNCGAIPAGLVESELFGHVKGAFTGALNSAVGRFELADGSTLFLDEVGELPPDTQIKLLRVLQEREFQPVGSGRTMRVDVRIIAATNRNLEADVHTGRFRSDLFYRLNVLPLRVPPLRERQSDIPQLVLFFLERACQKFGKKIETVSQDALDHLMAYDWPGNIREMQNVIERGVVLSHGPILTLDRDLLPVTRPKATAASVDLEQATKTAKVKELPHALGKQTSQPPRPLEDVERDHIMATLRHTGGTIDGPRGAAHILGLHPNTLRARMKKLGIERLSA
jgi:formate hydrogenlyase transcriptional activator